MLGRSGRLAAHYVSLLGLWLVLSGHTEIWLLAAGIACAALVALLSRRLGAADAEGFPIEIAPRAFRYLGWLLWEIVKANVSVGLAILAPRRRVDPSVYTVRPRQISELGQALYANSITITPGTVTIGVDGGALTVHALTRSARQGVEGGEMEGRIRHLLGDG